MTAPVIGGRYEHTKRRGLLVQVEALGDGRRLTRSSLVSILFLRSRQRTRIPLWLFASRFRRVTAGPVEASARATP